jgi:hypothetical protein
VPETTDDAYERGHLAGEIAARLAGHDRHFAAINGSLEKIAQNQAAQTLAIQQLADQAKADAVTRVATATALKDAEEARRAANDQHWSPFAKTFAVIATLTALVGATIGVYATFH